MKKKWLDISTTLKDGMVHWPGDPSIKIKKILDMGHGDPCTVSTLSMGSHTGTHMDAPAHFVQGTKSLDQMPLDAVIGKARVIEIRDKQAVRPEELKKHRLKSGERILFKTSNSSRCWKKSPRFVKDFVYISLEAAVLLGKTGIRSVGVDYLSVGGFSADGPAIHRALLSKGIWIIEGLDLSGVKAGTYELICLPLKIFKSDGAPARAILRPLT